MLLSIVRKILSVIRYEFGSLLTFIVVYFPDDYIGKFLRYSYWKLMLDIGENFKIERGAKLGDRRLLTIGHHFILGEGAEIAAGDSDPVWIGNHVGIARNSWIRSANHSYRDMTRPISQQGHESKVVPYQGRSYSIVIEDDVWIAPHAVILSGSHIGKGAIIAAGAVVSGPIPPYSLVVGNPGRIAKSRAA